MDPHVAHSYAPKFPLVRSKPIVEDRFLDLPEGLRDSVNVEFDEAGRIPRDGLILPDRFLLTLSPIILIRHPARMTESWFRNTKKTMGNDLTSVDEA